MASFPPRERLTKFFQAIKPEYVLGTTYTLSLAFFESVIFPVVSKERLRKCLILCDSKGYERAMAEATALRAATRDYLVATVPAKASFHAKVWLLVNHTQLVVIVGSGNLTQSGFVENLELFEAFQFERGETGASVWRRNRTVRSRPPNGVAGIGRERTVGSRSNTRN